MTSEQARQWVRTFDEIGLDDLGSVGGKNASLGELRRALGGDASVERRCRLEDRALDFTEGRLMKTNPNGWALIALIIAAPGFAAEPDPHAGHHSAPSAATPAVLPQAEAAPAPTPGGMMTQREGMGVMKGMGSDNAMSMQGMMDGSMPMEGHQHMMDHMAAMHGMSPSMMIRPSIVTRPMWEHVDACITFLKTELKITPAQTQSWEAFANRLRVNAAKMRNLRSSTQMGKIAQAPLVQRLDHQEKWFATGYENIHALKPIVIKLYGSLSQEQRKTADMTIPPHLDLMQAM